MTGGGEYGARAVLGVGTPQANPTVEPEVGALMPAGVNLLTTRLTSPVQNSRDRLIDYMDRLGDALRAYDVLRLDAFGLACTGSSYLIGAAREAEIVAAAEQTFGYPVITSAMAVRDGLMHLGVKRVALISPYPDWLEQASIAYWEAAGIEIVDTVRIDTGDADTRSIYSVTGAQVLEILPKLDAGSAEAVLLAGTGMPTLGALGDIESRTGLAAVSSNFCLAWALLRAVNLAPECADETLLSGWQSRFRARMA